MTPSKVRHLLSQFGDVSRLFLQDGSAGAQAKGSNQGPREKRKKHVSANYTEGWVEFEDKRVARGTAELLNAQPIGVAMGSCFGGGGGGAKKGGLGHSKRRWRDEVWTMRYLPGFKWNRLSEQLANERASHKSRLQAELSQSATEQRDYLKKVERARDPDASGSKKRMQSERTHTFRQRRALSSDVRDKQAKMDLDLDSDSKRLIKRTKHTSLPDDALDRVLGQIF
ncbi:TBP-binding protein, activator of basal transcription (contains rrm motif) [Ceraceosorus bombacis]|uniref:TBP-binding protein, activator of basal transcription (Contains rrm motif) n=1 Tax=Ceraceosorus bombacis TaxID=401625 RepID=A0A0P1BGQ3_9BASI|nr:TBP-binding protein, activator of basal transcription (contains rrm motif) [Ceraceosorus bombacis]